MIIQKIQLSDLETIAQLHKDNLVSPGSRIGEAYLKKLYRLLLSDTATHVCFLARENGETAGAITATTDLEKTKKKLRKLISLPMLILILNAILLRRVSVVELVRRLQFDREVLRRFPKPYVSILTLFVDKKYQRQGIGKRLINHTLKKLKELGVENIYVDTLLSNKKAIMFYKSTGFVEKETIIDSMVLKKQL